MSDTSTIQQFSHWPSWPLPQVRGDGAPGVRVTTSARQECNYLPGRYSTFRAMEVEKLDGVAYQRLMDAGFRRSGTIVYQPMCPECRECVPIRVPVEAFVASKSQRRVLKKNGDLEVRTGPPAATREKWELYNLYQTNWHGDAAEDAAEHDALSFVTFLYRSPVNTLEFEYRTRSGKLVGVGICDVCPTSLSSVYFYFDPYEKGRSLGTFSALYEISWAGKMKLTHWYAGYWISQCATMAYKSRFRPFETLGTDGVWRRGSGAEGKVAGIVGAMPLQGNVSPKPMGVGGAGGAINPLGQSHSG